MVAHVYHTCDHAELPDIAAYAYQDVHVLKPACAPRDRHFHAFLVSIYCAGLCCPSALHMALHCFSIKHPCVSCDILCPKALYGCVVLLFQTQDMEDQFGEWLLPILEKTLHMDPVPLQSPPPHLGDRRLATVSPPPPTGRPSRANGGDCKGGGGKSEQVRNFKFSFFVMTNC